MRVSVALIFVLMSSVFAQQPNSPEATQVVNGMDGPAWPVQGVPIQVGTTQTVLISGAPGMPFIAFVDVTLGATGDPSPAGIIDLDRHSAGVFVDGSRDPTFATGNTGQFFASFNISGNTPTGLTAAMQTLVADPTTPFFSRLTAAHGGVSVQGSTTITPSLNGTNSALIDLAAAGLDFQFYGTTYTSFHVNSSGNLTFGSPDSDFSSTPAEMAVGAPRISGFWTPLLPSPGSVSVTVNSTLSQPTVSVSFVNVPACNPTNCGGTFTSHSFSIVLNTVTNEININHDTGNVQPSQEILVGISPGGLGGPTVQTNLSSLPFSAVLGSPNLPLYEWFGISDGSMPNYTAPASNPYDLGGVSLNFIYFGNGSYIGS
jgi:hypothetical protein